MAEYIERERIRKALVSACLMNQNCPMFIAAKIDQMIDCEPAADVAPVVHGRWEMKSEDTTPGIYHVKKAFCTQCGKTNKQYRPPYCPHCGAKMDEEVTHDR